VLRVTLGRPSGVDHVSGVVGAALAKALAEATLKRVRARVDHPALQGLTVRGVNQYAAQIVGSRGGPGRIQSKRTVSTGRGGQRPLMLGPFQKRYAGSYWLRSVMGVGFGPLIAAEGSRITTNDLDLTLAV